MEANFITGMKNQDTLRARLNNLLIDDPQAISKVAKDMGIAALTLTKFLEGNDVKRHIIYLKILKFVESKEEQA